MHQTFYIDIDEEISSVIDRLNKSMSVDNYFVVPKRAVFLQSIVNLKLLKREADKVGKHVVIVTQDEIGTSMAERSGIEVRMTLEGLESIQEAEDEDVMEEEQYEVPKAAPVLQQKKQIRLSGVGSADFNDVAMSNSEEVSRVPVRSQSKNIPVNSISGGKKRKEPLRKEIPQASLSGQAQARTAKRSQVIAGSMYRQDLDLKKERTLEKIYSPRENNIKEAVSTIPEAGTETKIKKILIGFIGLCVLVFAGVVAYLFFPSAKIIIEPNILKDKINLDLHGASDINEIDQSNIPVRVIDKEESVSFSYEVKGGSAVAGKKAHGSIVIYNEYDNSAQTLIATTRFESEDGKIFRLVKNIVVPGMTTIGGETKPGAITAEIVADQPGPDYNIDPAKFTIPGFKGGPKYEKFYAKSAEQMTGGSIDGETAGGAVSQQDIDNAKQAAESMLKDKITQAIDEELSSGEIVLEQAEKITITKSSAGVKIGDMLGTFDYVIVASVRALVFSENDAKKIMEQSLKNEQQSQDVIKNISKIEYGTISPDFDNNTFELKVFGEVTITPILDDEKIKKELLGKNDDQLSAVLRKYPDIKSVNIEFQPTFVSRIPQYSQRVSVEIKNEAK